MEPPAADSLMLEDFGQRVDLTRRIREVLANYPEGTTVLKELIQNADDAGATRVCLCLDQRDHPRSSLLSPKLSEWQGPALLAFNDAVFTEDDFVSISRVGGSQKQGQAWKTGRFGVGFNSVYHLTDLPSFVSGKYVVLFDPQGVYLPNVSSANPGKRLEYVSSSAISVYKDQFSPYCAFGCDMRNPFNGTLFRFPLRNSDQAAASQLSRQAYTRDDISSMFVQLYKEAVFALLFLKNVLSVEMYIWDENEDAPRKLYSCSVHSPTEETVWHRQAILRLSKSFGSQELVMDTFSLTFLSEEVSGMSVVTRDDTFAVVQAMAPTASRIGSFAAAAAKEFDINLLPWASVAACVSKDLTEADVLTQGRAFCFLPLPVRTGLSVQVNAYFELSSNRRSIWFGEDMDRGGKLRSNWNRLLLEDVVAPTYTKLLLELRKILVDCYLCYPLWPSGFFEEPWNILVESIYGNICDSPVVYSEIEGGKWISPAESFLHDGQYLKSKELMQVLVSLGMSVVNIPDYLVEMVLKYASSMSQRVVHPSSIRHYLRGCENMCKLNRNQKLLLLEYCLQDLVDAEVGQHAHGLPLLPLANGEYGSFSDVPGGTLYLISSESEYELLRPVSDQLIDRDIPSDILNRLSSIAKSAKANISFLNVQLFLQLLPRFFPSEWKFMSRVEWEPDSCKYHPTASWFMLFWQYIRVECGNLAKCSDWPILPSIAGHLYQASKGNKLINIEPLSDGMRTILEKIGCQILNPKYGIEHQELFHYVYNCDGAGVIDAISDVVFLNGNFQQRFFQDISESERNALRQFLLDPKWYVGGIMMESHIVKSKKLPIYGVYDGGSNCGPHFSDLESPKKWLPPLHIPVGFLGGGEFIYSPCYTELDILVQYYGIKRMSRSYFYKEKVLNRISELQSEVRDSIMLTILQDLPQLCIEDTSLREYLRRLDFVPSPSGTLKSPEMLYDPRIEELFALLEGSDSFPCGAFQESHVLDMLQSLGLKLVVSPDTIIQSARQIESIMHEDPVKANFRGKVLLSYLEVNAAKWLVNSPSDYKNAANRLLSKVNTALNHSNRSSEYDREKFWVDLKIICWCPVLVIPPHPLLPWPVVSSTVAPPKLVRLQADMWLVSGSMRILDAECSSPALSLSFGWSTSPSGRVIAAQLLELGKNNEIITDQVLRKELALAMPRIYSILAGMVGLDEMDIVKAVLEESRWIWVGDGFATLEEVVLTGPFHLAPYVRVIPVDLAVFRDLFLDLGVRECLGSTDYAGILCRMAARKGSSPLDAQELRTAALVVQHLAEVYLQDQNIQIYLPDLSCTLFLASELVYNDAPWLLNSEDNVNALGSSSTISLSAKGNMQRLVHGNISNDVADKLGVCSLRRSLLAESADSMNLSLSGAAEAFGQHEALTTRLKHIVEMYADGPGILFELVQNADDAGASEVSFLLDKTQYGTSSLLSPEMAEWQGPALYCFNSSIFSSQDLHAISRIGQDSKLEKPFAIGRFGLGFNCVYHFTDIPGFVSGENIVMFDPHACNLPGISPSHPGLKIRFVGRKILDQFPDQFAPFLQFGCDLQSRFPGTLFRFPLRSEIAASRSQIKKEKYLPEDVLTLFSSFAEVVSETLLFLRNVTSISIFIKDGASHEMQLLHRVVKHNVNEYSDEPCPLHPMLSFLRGDQKAGIDKDQFLGKLSKISDHNLPWNCEKILVLEQSSSYKKLHLWMVSECLSGGQAKNKFLSMDKKSQNFIPYASVAAYLHCFDIDDTKEESNSDNVAAGEKLKSIILSHSQVPKNLEHDRKKLEGRAFCFLPLPISTGLPAHVNAYFELSSNRRDIWFGNDMAGGGKVRSDWNRYLLEDIVPPAYGHMLEKIALEVGPCSTYFSLWPMEQLLEPWTSMVRKFYKCISDLQLRVLFTKARGGQWITTKQALFPDFNFPRSTELAEVLSDAGLPLAVVSGPIVERFMEVCPSLHFLKPQLLRTLLKRRTREFKNKNGMLLALEYCLSDIEESVASDALFGLPLVPLASGLFSTFSNLGEGERIFVTSDIEYELLKDSVPHLIVDRTIPDSLLKKLQHIAQFGTLNISVMSCYLLEKLFPRLFPLEWQSAKQVAWDPQHDKQPSLEWMRLLWGYLKTSCADLSLYYKWPILPVQDGFLMQLVRNSNVIRDDGWSENMSSLLKKLGFYFVAMDLQIDHPQLGAYVQDATATGILNTLLVITKDSQDLEILFSDMTEGEMHELRSFIFQSKWFQSGNIEARHIELIKLLPMFETYKSRKLMNLCNPTKMLRPIGVLEELLDGKFVRTNSERESHILRTFLGVREPSMSEFYKNHVLSDMSLFLSQPMALSAILHDIRSLIEEDVSLVSVFALIPFIQAADGSWKPPSRLYDPRISGLQKLLHKEAFFPCDKFLNDETLETLVCLGLRKDLGFIGLLDSAKSVSLLSDSEDSETLIYARRLLFCLDFLGFKFSTMEADRSCNRSINFVYPEQEDPAEMMNSEMSYRLQWDMEIESCLGSQFSSEPREEFWLELRTIKWCPVYADPPIKGLPWFTSKQQVSSPNTVRPKSQMWRVSSVMYILEGDCSSQYLQSKLGWMDQPSMGILSNQLVELSKSYCQLKVDSELDPLLGYELRSEISSIYSMLLEFLDTDDFNILKSAVENVPCIWIGDNFVLPTALAFDSPVNFPPYLYVVPSELSEFRNLLLALGVKPAFDVVDYLRVLQRLQQDLKGLQLSSEQLNFVLRVLDAIVDCSTDKLSHDSFSSSLLIPDSSGYLMCAVDLVYNDAPWMEKSTLVAKHFVHPSVSNELADKLGVQSLRCLSLVDEELTKDLPCMDFSRISELLTLYGNEDFLLFDLLELADCCKATKLHVILDKRQHSKQTLLQQNFGEFQGPALTAVLEGASLTLEEVCCLQYLPPWKLRGATLTYGLGLLSCYCISHLLAVVSSEHYYIFDPLGLALSLPSSRAPTAKMFSLIGTDLAERFHDQFQPMLINQKNLWSSSNSTVIRMPLSSECMKDGLESGCERVQHILDRFTERASKTLLFLKSVSQVTLSTWEDGSSQPSQEYSVCIDPSSVVMRNPFSEKKWRKFQISRLFGGSSAAIKLHAIDIHVFQGGIKTIERWLVVLSLGSGQTRNMALDRRYLAYNLTPVGGVAALISQNGEPGPILSASSILSPLPLSGDICMPVVVLGCFLVCHNGGRHLFSYHDTNQASAWQSNNIGNHLIDAWNKELMCCVRDSYVEMILEFQKLRREPLSSSLEPNAGRAISLVLQAYGDRLYSFWPKSKPHLVSSERSDGDISNSNSSDAFDADWKCLVEQVVRPFYARLVDQPVWQLYRGNVVKADEGMFLSYSGNDSGTNLPPVTVCNFIKEHYPVFSVPWELVTEIQGVGATVREIKPKMVRDLLKASSTSIVLRSVETYVDVLDYCLCDIQVPDPNNLQALDGPVVGVAVDESHVGGRSVSRTTTPLESNVHASRSQHVPHQAPEALEIMSNLGRALFDFGRGIVEDIGRTGGSTINSNTMVGSSSDSDWHLRSIAAELKGLPCPTATKHLARLGVTELWVGSKEQQSLMGQLAAKFVHSECLGRDSLAAILSNPIIHKFLKLQSFSPTLLSNHMKLLFSEQWVAHVMSLSSAPWISWDHNLTDGGPSKEWIRLFWKTFGGSDYFALFSDWPLIPAFLGRPVLCRVRVQNLVFIPPITEPSLENRVSVSSVSVVSTSESELMQSYLLAFEKTRSTYPWLFPLLNQCNIPVYDMSLGSGPPQCCLPVIGQSLGHVIISKLLAAKHAGYYAEPVSFSDRDCDKLFELFALDFTSSTGPTYTREELDVLRTLPIHKTVLGTYVNLNNQGRCIISPVSFFKPSDERCLSYPVDSGGASLLHALGVPELQDQETLVRFALPGFERKSQDEKEAILIYVYMNWQDLQSESVVSTLKETKFVRSANELSAELFTPKDLLDPCDSLLASVFSGDKARFPDERFAADGWLHILRKTGLRTSSEPDMMLECAKKVALLGNEAMRFIENSDDLEAYLSDMQAGIEVEIWNLAVSVVETVLRNFANVYSNNFCSQLGRIAFVPSQKGFPTIGGKKGGMRVLTSYSKAILLKDWPLAWSCAPILAAHNVIPPEYSWGAFQLRSPPAFSMVLQHLQVVGQNGGEGTLAHWPTSSGVMSVEDASSEVLSHLNNVWGSLSAADVSELLKVAFIPVANGTRLVTANSLFVRLTINLSPFAFELPTFCLPFVKILKDIGLQDELSFAYAKELLINIQRSRGYQRLNPNELRAVMEILNFICHEGNKDKLDQTSAEMETIVPDDGCRLVLSRSCVYVDTWGSQFVQNIDHSRLRFVHPDLSEKICIKLDIKKLSEVVVEELDPEQELEVLNEFGPVQLQNIIDKLNSGSLHASLWTILKTLANYSFASEGVTFDQIQISLISMAQKIQFVRLIHTRFLLYPTCEDITLAKASVVPDWDHASKHRTLHFIDKQGGVILVAEPPSYMSVFDVIAAVVSRVLRLSFVLPVGSLFSCPVGSEKEILNILRLGSARSNVEAGGSSETLVGRVLLPQDVLDVQFHPLRPFYKGEIIAWRSRKDGEKLKYGCVQEDVRPSAGQALYRFMVETGPGETQPLLSSQVFSFRSISLIDGGSSVKFPVASQLDVTGEHLLAFKGAGTANMLQAANELQYGRVSSAELVQAVHEMLSAAGINMDSEKQTLLQTALTLQEELRESQAALLLEQEKADAATKEAESSKAAWSCRICLNAEVDTALNPCGHVLCRRCSAAVSRCPFCRLQVSKTLRIFRP